MKRSSISNKKDILIEPVYEEIQRLYDCSIVPEECQI